jgi:glycine/D-amino acid oxidase-like deaminating enzyme
MRGTNRDRPAFDNRLDCIARMARCALGLHAVATQQKDLRTGLSIWQHRRAPPVQHAALSQDIRTDVLVMGAGITGALIADALVSTGANVVVVDRRGPAQGSTVASTALVFYEIDTPLIRLIRKIGRVKAVRAWRRSRLAVEALAARLCELGMRDVTRRNSLYLAGDMLGPKELRRENEARQASGLSSRFLSRKMLHEQFGIARAAALMGYGNLVLDPKKATMTLLHAAAAGGARIFSATEVTEIAPKSSGVTATTANGCRVYCDHLVFATGYELPKGVPHRHHKITSTWAIATVRQAHRALWPDECCICEASDPYLFIRTTSEGRVLCGGEDEETSDAQTRDALLGRKAATLRRKLHRLLPKLDTTIEFAWTGAFGETTTGLPIIGEVPGMPRCWVALGYGGNGTTYAAIAADVITGAIAGRPDVDADLYQFPGHQTAD